MERGDRRRRDRRDRDRAGSRRDGGDRTAGRSQQQQPVILLKPKARLNDEEWPSISGDGTDTTGGGSSARARGEASADPIARSDVNSPEPSSLSLASTAHSLASMSLTDDNTPPQQRSQPPTVLLKSKFGDKTPSSALRGSSSHLASTYASPEPVSTSTTTATPSSDPTSIQPSTIPSTPSTGQNPKQAVQLISDNADFLESSVASMFDGENTDFLVIGVIGAQGAGKSTLLSMLGGNDPSDMYRSYIFRPASRDSVESCHHQTGGVQIYVTATRTILIDCQAVQSLSLQDDFIRTDRRFSYDYKTVENSAEVESVQTLCFLLQTCHVLLVCVDWFVDVELCRFLRLAAQLRPTQSQAANETFALAERKPVLAFVQQRSKSQDYQPHVVRNRAQLLQHLFKEADFQLNTGINLYSTPLTPFSGVAHPYSTVNYFPMSDIKLRTQREEGDKGYADSPRHTPRLARPPVRQGTPASSVVSAGNLNSKFTFDQSTPAFDDLLAELRVLVRRQPREPFINGQSSDTFTERQWLHYAGRCWDIIGKSKNITDYGRYLY